MTSVLALAGSGVANATLVSQTFSSLSGEGGIVTYQDTAANQLTLTFDNTSTLWNGAITGLVFNVSADIVGATIASFKDGTGANITGWDVNLNVDSSISPNNTKFDITFAAGSINGGIYNDGIATNTTNVAPDIATLILNITDPNPWSFVSIDGDSILRMQRTGSDGKGSLKLGVACTGVGCSGIPREIPEPASLLLMSAGLVGFGLARRRKSSLKQ